jgi:hypothetical protein
LTEEINKYLADLVGLQLTRKTRAANMQCFQFGVLTVINDKKSIGEFGLHIQCPWRITNKNEIIVGNNDLYEPGDEKIRDDENFNWMESNSNLRDIKLNKLLLDFKLIIQSSIVDNFGGLNIQFDNEIKLTVFPDSSGKISNEYWRLIDNRNKTTKHFISSSTGYEID